MLVVLRICFCSDKILSSDRTAFKVSMNGLSPSRRAMLRSGIAGCCLTIARQREVSVFVEADGLVVSEGTLPDFGRFGVGLIFAEDFIGVVGLDGP